MKKMRKIFLALAMLVVCLSISMPVSAAVKISSKSVTLTVGQKKQLKVTGTTKKVKWSSNKKKVAKVNQKGVVTAKSAGTAKITAKVGKKKYTCAIKVKRLSGGTQSSSAVPVVSFSLSHYEVQVKEGQSQKVETYIYPENATNKIVKWSSSNTSIATVDSYGNITGKSIGEATITASCDGKTSSCGVKVIKNFDEKEAANKVTYQTYPTQDGVVVVAKNNYKYPMRLDIDCVYYNEYGVMLGKATDRCIGLGSGKECALFCSNPEDSNYHDVSYYSFDINVKTTDADIIDNSSSITCAGNFGAENVMATITNNGQSVEFTTIAIVYYKSGQVIGYDYQYADVNNPGSTDYLEFNFPHDSEYNSIHPDNFKLYVNSSYKYDWQ